MNWSSILYKEIPVRLVAYTLFAWMLLMTVELLLTYKIEFRRFPFTVVEFDPNGPPPLALLPVFCVGTVLSGLVSPVTLVSDIRSFNASRAKRARNRRPSRREAG